jgi:hypothetical protein
VPAGPDLHGRRDFAGMLAKKSREFEAYRATAISHFRDYWKLE